MKRNGQRVARRRAFTLLEVLMVVVIIGILAALVVPNLFGTLEGARIDTAQSTITSGFNGALDLYRLHMGHYPTSDEGLTALVEKPDDDEEAELWRGPYLKQGTKLADPWNNPFIYESPGEYNEETYDLSSAGPNGQEGDDDDITNWEKS
ncbi:type II secretion system major pseudopilin GspG [uncultured Ilyobacter sp.]|uniref:type II secretion system major pseudopilin GspG n=1 Tax=uncultured Ilyobacter sp. TaxID=544433 RepID=UPI0029F52EAD|nr:type II secretion system major pseudopilin GspG [uncultured Ilyobacter sp.]